MRSASLDTQLAEAITAHRIAQKRGDTRSVHFWRERMRDLRTKQMRRDLGWRGKVRRTWRGLIDWLAPLARIAGTFGMMLVAGAVYSLVCPLDSYAAEAQPWVRDALHSIGPAISPPWGIIAIGFVICSALAAFIVTRIFAIAPRDDEPFHKPEDWGSQ